MSKVSVGESSTILVIDDDVDYRRLVTRWLENGGYQVASYASGAEGLEAMTQTLPDTVLLDMQMEGLDGMEVLKAVKVTHPEVPVIMLTSNTSTASIMDATREGAYDYLIKSSTDRPRLLATIKNSVEASQLKGELRLLKRGVEQKSPLIGASEPMRHLRMQMERVAPRDVTVLIHGESGTGKELVAHSIHALSSRARHPFVAVNCGAIVESLQGSELFGHEKGAFTGAIDRRIGLFEQADKGTLFLDEVAELSSTLQVSLLRVLQQRSFVRVGGEGKGEVNVNIRIIAASHRSLSEAVERGRFREDLYFRLAVFELDVPPLRARGEDILVLARQFIQSLAAQHKLPPRPLSGEAQALLLQWGWPGNVRELQNAMESALVKCTESEIRPLHLPARIRSGIVAPHPVAPETVAASSLLPSAPVANNPGLSAAFPVAAFPHALVPGFPAAPPNGHSGSMEEIQRDVIEAALRRNNQNKTAACKELDIPRTTFYRMLKRYNLS